MWETLESLVDEGKIRNIGVANYNQRELRELLSYARIKPALNQIEIHPRFDRGLIEIHPRSTSPNSVSICRSYQ